MNTELFEKLSALEGDTQLAEAIANVKAVPEMVTLLTSHGIPVTEDDINDLLKPSDELSENILLPVAAGLTLAFSMDFLTAAVTKHNMKKAARCIVWASGQGSRSAILLAGKQYPTCKTEELLNSQHLTGHCVQNSKFI